MSIYHRLSTGACRGLSAAIPSRAAPPFTLLNPSQPLVITLLGPTASGKTALSLEIAERLGLPVINVDSRQLYRGMDLGTAKPTAEQQARVPHHLLDLRTPDHPITRPPNPVTPPPSAPAHQRPQAASRRCKSWYVLSCDCQTKCSIINTCTIW